MEEIKYYNLYETESYYLNIPCCLGGGPQKYKYLIKFKKYEYSDSFNIIGIVFKVIKSFLNEIDCENIYLYVYKDTIYKPIYPLSAYFNHFVEQHKKKIYSCNIYKPNYELLLVNSIIRQKIGDPYFNWEFIYSN
jgi:hypothetical protein